MCAMQARLAAIVCAVCTAATAHARPRTSMVWEDVEPAAAMSAVNSHTIFLNRCGSAGCTVVQGNTNSTADPVRSSLGHGVLGPFTQGDATWNQVVACMKDVFSPFPVTVTDVDPGTQPHFEVIFGGKPQDLGMDPSLGGVSPFSCMPYVPNSVVFVFDVWGNDPEEICATGAQELAHSFALDHAVEPSDPMTYFQYDGRRRFQNRQIQCGSDCDKNHRSPQGVMCTGDTFQEHACACGNGAQTQNDVQVINALFSDVPASAPDVQIVEPKVGTHVEGNFEVKTIITDDSAVASGELRVDGALIQQVSGNPSKFVGPASLSEGTHTLEVTAYDSSGTPGRARVQVIVGKGCTAATDCPLETDVCVGGRCVAGPSVADGLGRGCSAATDCASWLCANDNGARYCVEACEPGDCPDGFGCRADGAGGGICWPGAEDSTAGCSATNGSHALVLLLALVLLRRKRG